MNIIAEVEAFFNSKDQTNIYTLTISGHRGHAGYHYKGPNWFLFIQEIQEALTEDPNTPIFTNNAQLYHAIQEELNKKA